MIKICFFVTSVVMFNSCSQMPLLFQSIEDIATDEAIECTVYKNAMQKNTDLKVQIDVINREEK